MPPKESDFILLTPAQLTPFTNADGSTVNLPVYVKSNSSDRKEYVQCSNCNSFLPLGGATRAPTYLAKHMNTISCRSTGEKLRRKQLAISVASEASLVHNRIFNPSPNLSSVSMRHESSTPSTSSTTTPLSSVPTTPTVASFRPAFVDMTHSRAPSHSDHIHNPLFDNMPHSSVHVTIPVQIGIGDLPRSSPTSSSGDSENSEDELPELEDLSDSDSENDEIEQHRDPRLPSTHSMLDLCIGQRVQWPVGSVWDTFPYQQHADDTIGWRPYLLDSDNDNNDWIRLKSTKCKGTLSTDREKYIQACVNCQKIVNTASFRSCVKRAEGDAAAHTPWKYLTPQQMRHLLVENRAVNSFLKLNVLSLSRRIRHLEHRVSDYQRIVMLLSQKKIAGVTQVLAVALRNGASASAIYDRLQSSITHTYSPRGEWTAREFDVAFLVKALGGPRLLFVLQKEEGYPSLTTLRRRRMIPEITVSTGIPSKDDFTANISAFLGQNGRKPPANPQIGQVLMMDGVALEESCRFDLKRNCILGLCREHASSIKVTVDDVKDVENVAHCLFKDQSIHHGKDGTVVGIAPVTERQDYYTVPLILSASCKTEKGADMAKWIPSFLEAYRTHPDGESRHGPIYVVATDGESSFRNLRFQIGLKELLPANSAIGKIIYRLPGMNRQTGAHGLLTTCDPKHIIKRFATMIRSPSGIQIHEAHLTTEKIRDALLELDNMPPEKVHQLLHPADKQNVPKAVNLLQSLNDLAGKVHGVNPAIQNRMRLVVFLAKALGYFLFPFIDVQMSLSEQIRCLSSYAHLMTAMYRRHRTAFMTSALFADSQAIIKNIFFTVARLQALNPTHEYFILFEGTDRLEGVFSNARTQDHARNFDILQLAQKLSIAAEVNAIFQRNSDLNRGHIRRNLVNVRGVDHINPASWRGNAVVGDVDIVAEYLRGRDDANNLLAEYLGEESRVDFDSIFSASNVDHLRPFGRYIGSRLDDDGATDTAPPGETQILDEDDEPLEFRDDVPPSIEFDDVEALDLRDTVMDSTADSSMMDIEAGEEINPVIEQESHRLIVDGKSEFKPSLIARLLTSESGKKVTTRPLRARGIAVRDALQSRMESLNQSLQGEVSTDHIKSGDLGTFFVRVGKLLCFATGEVMSFQKGTSKIPFSSVTFEDLGAKAAKDAIAVTAQILELKPANATGLGDFNWIWPSSRRFVRIQGKKDSPQSSKDFILQIPGTHFHPSGPSIIDDKGIPTWSISHNHLQDLFQSALALIIVESNQAQTTANIQQLPIVTEASDLPYKLSDSTPQLYFSLSSTTELPAGKKKEEHDNIVCRICDKSIPLKDMRNHIGQHILLSLRNCEDIYARKSVGPNPCGWCGLDGKCRTQLIRTATTMSITSNCEYHYSKMIYKKAIVPSKRTPSTNVPLNCPLCIPNGETCTFWKYNLLYHMTEHHLLPDGRFPPFPHQLLVQSHITKAEEVALGVGERHTTSWREKHGWPQSDGLDAMAADTYYELGRKRAGSDLSEGSTASRQPSPTKRSHLS